ncbi:HD domain-containing protein [bacterium]|nr:HD domain-containing protein [bacterium]
MKILKEKFYNSIFEQFRLYYQSCLKSFPEHTVMIQLKWDHGLRVQANMNELCDILELNTCEKEEAILAGLLHDAGRFEQFIQYGTFVDAQSTDHAELGCEILQRFGWLKFRTSESMQRILKSISEHNKFNPTPNSDNKTNKLIKMLRDCDKLDILKLVSDYYHNLPLNKQEKITLNLPDKPYISEIVYDTFLNSQMVRKEDLHTINDFKILQMGWIYDINFSWTAHQIEKHEYLDLIIKTLPDSIQKKQVQRKVSEWIDKKKFNSDSDIH